MSQIAVLISEGVREQEVSLLKLLDFFGISSEQAGPADLWNRSKTERKYCVFCSMSLLARAIQREPDSVGLPPFLSEAQSVYLYGGGDCEGANSLLQWITGSSSARIVQADSNDVIYMIRHGSAVCGPMSGLAVRASGKCTYSLMQIPSGGLEPLISTKDGIVFGSIAKEGVPYFFDPCSSLIDIGGGVEKNFFDIRDHFCAAVPIVSYLRFSFGDCMWSPAENGACVVVDDIPLRPRYGFFNFQQVASLGLEHDFCCSIGFIPWNWRRSRSSVVRLLKQHSKTMSLCVHGCDHTGREFGSHSVVKLNEQSKTAIERMRRHLERTGLQHDAVMVFPQGVFSAEALSVLKHNDFIAAVNTEISPVNGRGPAEIKEAWSTAITKYGDFPIYTRRYAFHGLANFAFDLLLGKPCIIVTHHQDFYDECRDLVSFIDQINALPVALTWRSLGEVIRRAYRQRLRDDGVLQVTMFAGEIVVKNPTSVSRHVVVERLESSPEWILRIEIPGHEAAVFHGPDGVRVEFDLPPGDDSLVRLRFKDIYGPTKLGKAWSEQVKVSARRYLSELRDQAQVSAPWAVAVHSKTRQIWRTVANGAIR